jgi:hypothetical protein
MHTRYTERSRFAIHKALRRHDRPSRRRVALAIALTSTVASCSWLPGWTISDPPVDYLGVRIVIADRGDLHRQAGLYFSLANVSNRTIESLEIAFDLYDGTARPVPGVGRNARRIELTEPLETGATRRYCVSLDALLDTPRESLLVSRFRVTRARFDDGTVWRNTGAYVYAGSDA